MNRTVKLRQRKGMPIRDIFLDPDPNIKLEEQIPDLQVTRTFIGVVPPKGRAPGYACVIGEIYDNDPAQHTRERIMLDEGIALDPADFTDEECVQFSVHAKSIEHPTIESLRRAVVMLKDLWLPDIILVPPPGDDTFGQMIRITEGLTHYDRRMEAHFQYWFPHYRVDQPDGKGGFTEPLAGVVCPEEEDSELNAQIVMNLFSLDLLTIQDFPPDEQDDPTRPCKHYHQRREQWDTIHRAMGLTLHHMQDMDMTFAMREWEDKEEGYTEASKYQRKEAEEAMEIEDELISEAAWMAGIDMDQMQEDGEIA